MELKKRKRKKRLIEKDAVITMLTKWRVAFKQPEVANGSHMCCGWSLRAEKVRRNRCEFDFTSIEAK